MSLPGHAAVLGDEPKVPIALGRRGLGSPARHRVLAWRDDDRRLGMAFGHYAGHVLPVIGAVTRERGDRSRHLVEQGPDPRAVICLVAGQLHGLDPAGPGIHAQV